MIFIGKWRSKSELNSVSIFDTAHTGNDATNTSKSDPTDFFIAESDQGSRKSAVGGQRRRNR